MPLCRPLDSLMTAAVSLCQYYLYMVYYVKRIWFRKAYNNRLCSAVQLISWPCVWGFFYFFFFTFAVSDITWYILTLGQCFRTSTFINLNLRQTKITFSLPQYNSHFTIITSSVANTNLKRLSHNRAKTLASRRTVDTTQELSLCLECIVTILRTS